MNKLPAYSSYTDTDIDWIEKYPSHWQLIPCRAVVDHIVEKNEGGKIQNYLSLMANVGVIRYEDKGDIGNKKPEDLSKCKIVKKGQLVINSMNYSIGSYGMSPYNGVCSSVYIILEPKKNLLNRYGLRVFENSAFQKHLATFGNGILAHRAAIGWDDIKGEYIPLAPKDEQEKILQFLDHETAKIDTLIEKQQTLIQLLKEKRQAVISHAVTKGLNPDAPMKDSGVEWLGEVPEHWEVMKGAFIGQLFGSESVPENQVVKEGILPFIKVSTLSRDGFELQEPEWFVSARVAKNYKTRTSYVVFPKRGAAIFTNKVNVVNEPSLIDPNLMGWQINEKALSKYIALLLKTRKLDDIADVSTVPQINNKHINPEKFPLPPIKEQQEILDYIDGRLITFDDLIDKAEQAIQLMQERRTALISAAVTGKIDVRGWRASE